MSSIKKCYCKKSFISKLWLGERKLFFNKGKTYLFYIEDGNNPTFDGTTYKCAWVIYGEGDSYGIRFHQKKCDKKIGELHNFYDYFENNRLKKLEKINKVQRGE